jgi:hypothetical protein
VRGLEPHGRKDFFDHQIGSAGIFAFDQTRIWRFAASHPSRLAARLPDRFPHEQARSAPRDLLLGKTGSIWRFFTPARLTFSRSARVANAARVVSF